MISFINVDSDVWLTDFSILRIFFLSVPTLLICTKGKKVWFCFFFPSPVLYVNSEFATKTISVFQKRQATLYKFYEMILGRV